MVDILYEALDNNTEIMNSCCHLGLSDQALGRVIDDLIKAGMLPPPLRTDAVTSSIVYCYYPEVEEIDIDGTLDIAKSKLWEDE